MWLDETPTYIFVVQLYTRLNQLPNSSTFPPLVAAQFYRRAYCEIIIWNWQTEVLGDERRERITWCAQEHKIADRVTWLENGARAWLESAAGVISAERIIITHLIRTPDTRLQQQQQQQLDSMLYGGTRRDFTRLLCVRDCMYFDIGLWRSWHSDDTRDTVLTDE